MFILMYRELDGSLDEFEPILCKTWKEVMDNFNYYIEEGVDDEDQMFDKNKFVYAEFDEKFIKKVIEE